jgi:hypothetical protein
MPKLFGLFDVYAMPSAWNGLPNARARYRDEGRRTFLAGFSAEAMTRRFESLYLRQAN